MNPSLTITRLAPWLLALGLVCAPPLRGAEPDLAAVAKDVARIKPLLAHGEELAGAYTGGDGSPIRLSQGDDYLRAVASSYLFADFRHHGSEDLVVAVEAPPDPARVESGGFGPRTLVIFTATDQGSWTRSGNPNLLLDASQGGLQGDPFSGFRLTHTGAFQVVHSGGSSDRWTITQTFQFRKDLKDFYQIGETRTELDTDKMTGHTLDWDFLTGVQELQTLHLNHHQPDPVTTKPGQVHPLVKFADAKCNLDDQ